MLNLENYEVLKPDLTPGAKARQVTVDRYVDYNCHLVLNKIVRSKSQTRKVDEKNYYQSLCLDKRTSDDIKFENKVWKRAKEVMKKMIDLR